MTFYRVATSEMFTFLIIAINLLSSVNHIICSYYLETGSNVSNDGDAVFRTEVEPS